MDRAGGGQVRPQLTAGVPPTTVPVAAGSTAGGLLSRCTFPPPGTELVCAVSGGADSLALLVLATHARCAVTVVHVDHGIRPGSAREADLVAAAAARLGARFRAERVAVAPGANLEARARAARYAVLPPGVATGHTMDDQAETVLCNLLRGAGPDGVAGMRAGYEHPILGLRRAETKAVCREAGLEWLEDPTNADPAHLRNRVRLELLPLCGELTGRDPVPLIARFAALQAQDTAYLADRAAAEVPDPADAASLVRAPAPLASRAVRRWLRALGATPRSGGRDATSPGADRQPPSYADVCRVLGVAAGDAVATQVSGGWRVRRSHGRLSASPPDDRPAAEGDGLASVWVHRDKVTQMATGETHDVAHGALAYGAATASVATSSGPAPAWAAPGGVGPVLVDADAIAAKVAELGARITADFADDPPLLVGVLKGAMLFMSDLCRAIELPVDVDFMAVSSYGSATQSSGVVRIVKDLDADLAGRHVLVVEDIIDSGLTLNYLRRYLQARNPASLEVCALLVKEGEQRVPLELRYVGFTIPSAFVVGYGLDVGERYRNLRSVHVYRPDGGGR